MSDLINRQAALDDAHRQIWYRMNQQGMKDRIDEWLNNLPSAVPTCNKMEQVEDCISRQAAINAAKRTDYRGLSVEDVTKVTDAVIEEIKRLPSAQPERKKGNWLVLSGKCTKNIDKRIVECSVCFNTLSLIGVNAGRGDANFCPNCGADMRNG